VTALKHFVGTPAFDRARSVTRAKSSWTSTYVPRLALTDGAAIVGSVSMGQLVRFGTDPATMPSQMSTYSYTVVSTVLIVAWIAVLSLFRSREPRAVGNGIEEYRRVASASTTLFGAIAIVAFLLNLRLRADIGPTRCLSVCPASCCLVGCGASG
jgi:hypothetical protein